MLQGKYWQDGKHWLIEVSEIDVMTQGHSEAEALEMIVDAINGHVNADAMVVEVFQNEVQKAEHKFSIRCADSKYSYAFHEWVKMRKSRIGKRVHENAVLDEAFVVSAIDQLIDQCHRTAREKGWWDEERSDGELIALMHSELSEALEWSRKGNGPSDHIPPIKGLDEELADVLIRIFDFCGDRGINLGRALLEKMKFNEGREYKHGGKKF